MFSLAIDMDGIKRTAAIIVAALTLTACAGSDVVGDKSRRFDQATAAFDAGDYASAYTIWSQLADENDLAAMRNTAHLLRKGLGVEKDPGRALDLYTEAARKGLVLAMANVAEMHMTGEGTLKDPEEAARWYALAANGGLSIAMVRLAEMFEQGVGVPKDPAKARELYAQAEKNGFVVAPEKPGATLRPASQPAPKASAARSDTVVPPQTRRASQPVVDALDRKAGPRAATATVAAERPTPAASLPPLDASAMGAMAPQDAQKLQAGWAAYQAGQMKDAFKLWQALAEKGVPDAQLRLGGMFEHGIGINKDMIEAYRWYRLAAASNNGQGAAGVERVVARLSPAEKAIAESMAATPQHWQSRPR